MAIGPADTGELPFVPAPADYRDDRTLDWRDRVFSFDRRPMGLLIGAVIASLVLAAFVAQDGDGAGTSSDMAALAARPADGGTATGSAENSESSGESASDGSAGSGGAPRGRSSGEAFPDGDENVLAVQVIEPDEVLAGPPTTGTPPPTGPSTSATVELTTTTEAVPTTAEATTTDVTSTTEPGPGADDIWVTAQSPGSSDSAAAPGFRPGDIVLRAEGSDAIVAYRFRLEVRVNDDWRRAESSGWSDRSEFDTWFRRYRGRTIRWTVQGRAVDGTETPDSAPLYLVVE